MLELRSELAKSFASMLDDGCEVFINVSSNCVALVEGNDSIGGSVESIWTMNKNGQKTVRVSRLDVLGMRLTRHIDKVDAEFVQTELDGSGESGCG